MKGMLITQSPPLQVTEPPESVDAGFWRLSQGEGIFIKGGKPECFLQVDGFDHKHKPFDMHEWARCQTYIVFAQEESSVTAAFIQGLTLAFQANLICDLTVASEGSHFRFNINPTGDAHGNKATH